MALFQVGKDFDTPRKAGAAELFQIDTLIDENENNVTNMIDVGTFFHDNNELKRYLSRIFEIAVEEIELENL
ncbi:hypothetical protein [Aquimarina algiphila]|uniref:Uncharacterized protein n=1 Tax=Aquimarina algiphila TaxID=2047982 RepID=A0A554VCD2_9FLAO|nr:hypothetical protein [Aquimarina algiphila]TSE04368.1 hypothetical protein FOF46_26445 [Aquimarina algiphila]